MSDIDLDNPFPEPVELEITDVFDLHTIPPRDVKAVVEEAAQAGLDCAGHTVEALHPWEAITDHAKSQGCDLIVMASHGRRGVSALLLGSETQKVLTHCTVPILVVK